MEYWKEVLDGLKKRFNVVIVEKNGVIYVADSLNVVDSRVAIGNKTYIVSSFFKNDAKSNAVDKVRRLIERESENLMEK